MNSSWKGWTIWTRCWRFDIGCTWEPVECFEKCGCSNDGLEWIWSLTLKGWTLRLCRNPCLEIGCKGLGLLKALSKFDPWRSLMLQMATLELLRSAMRSLKESANRTFPYRLCSKLLHSLLSSLFWPSAFKGSNYYNYSHHKHWYLGFSFWRQYYYWV